MSTFGMSGMSEVKIIKKMKKKIKTKQSNNVAVVSNQLQQHHSNVKQTITTPVTTVPITKSIPITKSNKEMKKILALLLETMISEKGLVTKNDLDEIKKQHNDEIYLLKDEIKQLENKNNDMLLNVNSIVELERQKRLQLIKKVYKKHNDDYEKLNKDINITKDDNSDSLYNIQNKIKSFSKELPKIKENIDELGLHCFGHKFMKYDNKKINNDDSPRHKKRIENNNSSHFDERDLLNNSYDDNNNITTEISTKGLGGIALREMVNDMQLDVKELEAEVGDIRHLFMETMQITKDPNNNRDNKKGNDNANDNLSKKIREVSRHTTNACTTLASGN
jgi:hypothetical protein